MTSKNTSGSYVEIDPAWDGGLSIRTLCPVYDKVVTTKIVLSHKMAWELIAELQRAYPERRKADRRSA